MRGTVLLLHLLGATIWTGGHLVLACSVLPGALRRRDPRDVRQFEQAFERIGIPALIVQVCTGIWLAFETVPDLSRWIDPADPVGRLIGVKLLLLLLTVGLAIDARFRIIPHLDAENLVPLAWHILPVTLISVLFVVVGVSFRTGWFF